MRELSRLFPVRSVSVGFLLGCGFGAKLQPNVLSSLSLRVGPQSSNNLIPGDIAGGPIFLSSGPYAKTTVFRPESSNDSARPLLSPPFVISPIQYSVKPTPTRLSDNTFYLGPQAKPINTSSRIKFNAHNSTDLKFCLNPSFKTTHNASPTHPFRLRKLTIPVKGLDLDTMCDVDEESAGVHSATGALPDIKSMIQGIWTIDLLLWTISAVFSSTTLVRAALLLCVSDVVELPWETTFLATRPSAIIGLILYVMWGLCMKAAFGGVTVLRHISIILRWAFCALVYLVDLYDICLLYAEHVIQLLCWELLYGILAIFTYSFLLIDTLVSAFFYPSPPPAHWNRRKLRLLERFQQKEIILQDTQSVPLYSSNLPSPKEVVEVHDDDSCNAFKYDPIRYVPIKVIKRTDVADVFVVVHKVTAQKLVYRVAGLKGPNRQSIVRELYALTRVQKCIWCPHLMHSLNDGAYLHVLTEYYPRGNLRDYMEELGGCLDRRFAEFYLAELLIAIRAIHERGIMHCRISLENILINDDRHLVISNFSHSTPIRTIIKEPQEWDDIAQAQSYSKSDYYHMALVYHEMVSGCALEFISPSVHVPVAVQIDHLQEMTEDDISFITMIIDSEFPARDRSILRMESHPVFQHIDLDAVSQRAVGIPRARRLPKRNTPTLSFTSST
ncbi:hypothetical protein BDZ97DRAFT_1821751 [Flammula alnicola]|nr:hypothetical protein BDZ97DRAFT_1821751 [Flammula alnicola]